MGTSTGTIMVKKWGDSSASSSEGGTTPVMEVFTVTTAAGDPPRPRRILLTRFDATGALAKRVGRRFGSLGPGGGSHRRLTAVFTVHE